MSSGMNSSQAEEYAKTMTYKQAISNIRTGKGIAYRKATMIKLHELAEIADKLVLCKERGDDHNEVRCRVCEYDNAIIQIDALPSVESHNKDAISREGLLKSWEELSPRGRTEFDQVIMTIPATTSAEPKTGEWIKATGMMPPEFHGHHCCSECGNFANMEPPFGNREGLSKFCPNCGAIMRRTESEVQK